MPDRSSSPKPLAFDPYSDWLGISPDRRPPSYYDLFGLRAFESDPAKIEQAALRRMGKVRQHQLGPHGDVSQEILEELARARLVLIDPDRRADYDARLRGPAPTLPPPAPSPARSVPAPAATPAPASVAEEVSAFPTIITGEEGKLKVSPRSRRRAARVTAPESREGEEAFSLRDREERPSAWRGVSIVALPLVVVGFSLFRHKIPGLSRPVAPPVVGRSDLPRPIPPPDSPRIAPPEPEPVPVKAAVSPKAESPPPKPVVTPGPKAEMARTATQRTEIPKAEVSKPKDDDPPKPAVSEAKATEADGPKASDAPEAASKLLSEKGLKRTGQFLLLPDSEAKLREKYNEVSALYQQCVSAMSRCSTIAQQDTALAEAVAGRAMLFDTINAGAIQLNAMPRRSSVDRAAYQQASAQRNTLIAQLRMVDQQLQSLRAAQPTAQVRKEAYSDAEKALTAVREGVAELRKAADSVKGEYETLARDPEVKAALAHLHTRPETARVKLGPSDKFLDLVKKIRNVEKEVGAQKAVPSATPKTARKKAK